MSKSPELDEQVFQEAKRLRWQCRRGMLELDYLLERYLEKYYPRATEQERLRFRQLLALQDPILNEWLVVGSTSPDPIYSELVLKIKNG